MSEVPGYGEPACYQCKLILLPGMWNICKAMVYYTRLQIDAADHQDWPKAIVMEGRQNDLAEILNDVAICGKKANCEPGFKKV